MKTVMSKIPRRFYSAKAVYIDDWYKQIMKSKQFYDKFANGKPRRYFYNIDLQGRLFLEETSPKNVVTSIKDEKFLDFFFSRIRSANAKESEFLKENDASDDYPFVSKCGVETNFIRPAATPIVFHSLVHDTLFYGGSLGVPFESDRLAISTNSGKFYYRISDGHTNESTSGGTTKNMEYGLINTSIGVALSNNITTIHESSHDEKFLYDNVAEIDWLPRHHEPGKWAMPDDESGS
jgi:hypothetical protein